MLAFKKSWIFIKNYWWFPIGALSFIIWMCARNNHNKSDIVDLLKASKAKADEELTAAKNAFEEEKKINKAYNDALKKVAEEEKKSVREIKKTHKEKLMASAKKNRGDKNKMAKELAERYGLKL
tara:strand:- start:1829 stop:2200 length:372 start_codon:yes stop_codon:yes gene_type:complete